ncbi:MAG: hypothetical protein ABFR65_12950 [Pseudomonadota bacterium]
MNERRSLIVDADLELTNGSGSRVSLRLKSGQGVVELSDAALLRWFIKDYLASRQRRGTLQRMLYMANYLNPKIDISVIGKRIARVDTERGGGFICGLLGLPGLRIWPFAFVRALFK